MTEMRKAQSIEGMAWLMRNGIYCFLLKSIHSLQRFPSTTQIQIRIKSWNEIRGEVSWIFMKKLNFLRSVDHLLEIFIRCEICFNAQIKVLTSRYRGCNKLRMNFLSSRHQWVTEEWIRRNGFSRSISRQTLELNLNQRGFGWQMTTTRWVNLILKEVLQTHWLILQVKLLR